MLGNPELYDIRLFPSSLKCLRIEGFLISSNELTFAFRNRLTNLSQVELVHCGTTAGYGVNLDVLEALAEINSLRRLRVKDFNNTGDRNLIHTIFLWACIDVNFGGMTTTPSQLDLNDEKYPAQLVLNLLLKRRLTDEDNQVLREVFMQ